MKKIMIAGTMSGAGKSFLVTALCRIFAQDGYRVSPFKSQNMSLNSYVSKDGCEIGRAQAVQAMAAGAQPEICMNPVLLKPTGEMTSQVMVMGESHGLMDSRRYQSYKSELRPVILEAFDRLGEKNDIIVIEGAGSVSEINLKENDIVNLGLAQLLKAPVLLTGDIDRGGVFAQLLGSVEWMDEAERELLKGFIINKFRGDVSLLTPGIDLLTARTGSPTLGVVPYVNADIEDEDSLSPRLGNARRTGTGQLKACVIKLPTISNFTDFNVFERQKDLDLIYTADPSELDDADIIFIPGSKNTASDMQWMDKCGLSEKIKKKASGNTVIFGICGGLQMLGETLEDPEYMDGKPVICLSLLPLKTVYDRKKKTEPVSLVLPETEGLLTKLSGMRISGYEIHMGKSYSTVDGSEVRGLVRKGDIYASYVHGFFDSCGHSLVRALCQKKGLTYTGEDFDLEAYRQEQFDLLADAVRRTLDMDKIYNLMDM